MYNLEYKDGLLYASVILQLNGKSVKIDDVIIDTGAFHTIILSDYLDDLEAEFSEDDILVKSSGYGGNQLSSVRKRIDEISIGDISLSNTRIDFGQIDPFDRVNGLIGLDFLKGAGIIIDLDELSIFKKSAR